MIDFSLVRKLIVAKLHERNTYVLALIVGLLINLYGQILVPWLRGASSPLEVLANHFDTTPLLTIFSILLGFLFPLCVGVYSAVTTRYKGRRIESIADFPESKPDPVFRVDRQGNFIEAGKNTQLFFQELNVKGAQDILGAQIWENILSGVDSGALEPCHFERAGHSYIVRYTETLDKNYNIYLTQL